MKNGLSYLIKLIVSFLLLIYTETYFFKLMNLLNLNISMISDKIISLIINIIMFIIIFYLYKKEIISAFNKYDNKIGSNLLYSGLAFLILFAFIIITNYITKIIADAFSVNYLGVSFINIFNKPFNLDLIIVFLKDIVIIPTIKVIIFVLGVNNLFESKTGILFSGLIYALYKCYLIGGSFIYLAINAIPYFIIFMILSYIYKKNNNIAFSIVTFVMFNLFSSILMGKVM